MNSCLKILFISLIVSTLSWMYIIPLKYKFFAKIIIHRSLFVEPSIIDLHNNVTVQLSLGKIIGTTIKPNLVDTYQRVAGKEALPVHQFLGIPFAEPPLKNLRFKKPKPVSKWSPNVIEATQWKHQCLQPTKVFDLDFLGTTDNSTISEDCLYLNIWTPSLPSETNAKLKPVFVWIYGGAYTIGGASVVTNHGYVLSSTQDIVFVSMNYRLGPLGFLSPPKGVSTDTNSGLWDQIQALEFVQDHIKYFGGDPNDVTLGGLSAGAMSVSALFASPVTRNLFNNIIFMSGSSLIPTSFLPKENEVAKTKHLAKIIKCPTNDDNLMMKCLMEVDGRDLVVESDVGKSFPYVESFGNGFMLFGPVIGDDLLPEKMSTLLTNATIKNKNVRVLTGLTNWEGGIMKYSLGHSETVRKIKTTIKADIMTQTDWFKGIVNYLINDYKASEDDAKLVANYYLNNTQSPTNADEDYKGQMAAFTLIGDLTLACPVYFETELIADNVKSVHHYVYSYKGRNEIIDILCPEKYSDDPLSDLVCHGIDISYQFGNALLKSDKFFYNLVDYQQSIANINLIGSFVRGDPLIVKRKDGKVNWINYENKKKVSLEMNYLKNFPLISNFNGEACNLIKKYIIN